MIPPDSSGSTERGAPAGADLLREALADLREHPPCSASPMTQKTIARELTLRADLYRKLESGLARWLPDVVDEASRMLGGTLIRPVLYRLALGARPSPHTDAARDTSGYRQIIEDWPGPALLVEDTGIVTCLNVHASAWFPPLTVGTPLAAAILCDPAARNLLADWPRWAALAAADLRYAAARRIPGRAGRLVAWAIRRALADAEAAGIWNSTSGAYHVDDAEPLRVQSGPGGGRSVRLLVSEPGAYPGRIIRIIEVSASKVQGSS